VVGKESRDRLKVIHRTLRDHYRDIANEITRSLNESLQSTITAAHVEEAERDNTVRELERQLDILNQVIDNVDKLAPPVTVGRV
jgi:ubiquinone biosynthesis protein UbiJ